MRPYCNLRLFFQFQKVILRNFNGKQACLFCTSQKDGTSMEEDKSPFHPTEQQLRKADHFFTLHGPRAYLEESGFKIGKFTKLKPLPEVAMLGRTSVGKSSLINALLRQKKLARTSKRPGHTRLINYFNVGSKFYLVDLPGYGYIDRLGSGGQHFVRVVENYIKHRAGKELKSICLLIDGKVGIKKTDLIAVEMLEEMDAPFHVAITKIDNLKAGHQELNCRKISEEIMALSSILYPHVFPVSSKEQTGLSDLRYFMGLCTGLFE